MQKTYKGTDATPGFTSSWKGNSDVGEGEQEIKAISPDRIDYELRFLKPMKSRADAYMTVDSIGLHQTKVGWGFKSSMPYPMNGMQMFMNMKEAVGKDLEQGLQKLKPILEK